MNVMVKPNPDIPIKQPILHCMECGYNLTGVCSKENPVGRCPECGAGFDRVKLIRRANELPALGHWPMTMVFVWPVLAAVLSTVLFLAGAENFVSMSMSLFLVCGVVQSVNAGFLISERQHLKNRRNGQSKSISVFLSATAQTIALIIMQFILAAALFFAGCACVINVFGY